MVIELYVLVDNYSKIYYTGQTKEQVQDYKDSIFYNDNTKHVVKLIGELPKGD